MPKISQFYGITVFMNFREHEPAHFHATYGESEVLINIETLAVYRGSLPRRAMSLIIEWAGRNQHALRDNWRRVLAREHPIPIPPLE